jgi:hypothetical protein
MRIDGELVDRKRRCCNYREGKSVKLGDEEGSDELQEGKPKTFNTMDGRNGSDERTTSDQTTTRDGGLFGQGRPEVQAQ